MDEATRASFHRGLALYNRGKYLECQAPLEDVYRLVDEADQPLLRALIALACGMHVHFNRGGGRAAENLFRRSLIEMDDFRPAHLGVDVDDLARALESYLEEIRGRRKRGATFFDRWLAPRIRYG